MVPCSSCFPQVLLEYRQCMHCVMFHIRILSGIHFILELSHGFLMIFHLKGTPSTRWSHYAFQNAWVWNCMHLQRRQATTQNLAGKKHGERSGRPMY